MPSISRRYQQEKLHGLAQDQYVRQIEIPARRGDIFDRRGTPLAQSVEVDSIWVDPSMLPDVRKDARALAKALKLGTEDAEDLQARLLKAKRFAWVKRQAKPQEVEAVKALGAARTGLHQGAQALLPAAGAGRAGGGRGGHGRARPRGAGAGLR